jgi:hypothetical protein
VEARKSLRLIYPRPVLPGAASMEIRQTNGERPMFSKHTFGARSYGHYQGYREKGDTGPGVTNAWRAARKAKRLRAEAFRASRGAAKSQRPFAKISSTNSGPPSGVGGLDSSVRN